jgi:hypothetical protein
MLFELPDSAQHRQQHRRTLDGRLCAAAFVFDRQTHVGCSDGTNPAGEHGREWCYVDAQVAHASSLGVQCVCVCVRSVFRYCNACSYWTVVVGSLRGVIAVIHFMRRFGEQRACTGAFQSVSRNSKRALVFAASGEASALLRDAPSCAQRRACARIWRQPAL